MRGDSMATSKVSGIFAETTSLASWESELKTLNDNAISIIGQFTAASDLKGSFEGDKSDGISESIEEKMRDAQNKHEKMSDFSGFLQEVIASMEQR